MTLPVRCSISTTKMRTMYLYRLSYKIVWSVLPVVGCLAICVIHCKEDKTCEPVRVIESERARDVIKSPDSRDKSSPLSHPRRPRLRPRNHSRLRAFVPRHVRLPWVLDDHSASCRQCADSNQQCFAGPHPDAMPRRATYTPPPGKKYTKTTLIRRVRKNRSLRRKEDE